VSGWGGLSGWPLRLSGWHSPLRGALRLAAAVLSRPETVWAAVCAAIGLLSGAEAVWGALYPGGGLLWGLPGDQGLLQRPVWLWGQYQAVPRDLHPECRLLWGV
jgi:hypothetical protein